MIAAQHDVDVVARCQWGNFTHVMFYDGQGMLVRATSGFTTLKDLDGATICVTTGTTTEQNLADAFREGGLTFTPVTFEDTAAVYSAYERRPVRRSDQRQVAAGGSAQRLCQPRRSRHHGRDHVQGAADPGRAGRR